MNGLVLGFRKAKSIIVELGIKTTLKWALKKVCEATLVTFVLTKQRRY